MPVRTTRMFLSATVPVITALLIVVMFRPHTTEPRRKSGLLRFENFETGDIIFQVSSSAQSQFIQEATHSPYSHIGVIHREGREYRVYEAVQPVKLTSLSEWIKRGEKGHYVVKRLNDTTLLTPAGIERLKKSLKKHLNKDYDVYFEWTDDKMYCSELVWKAYEEAFGIRLGEPQLLQHFDLSSDLVKAKLKERYGDKVPLTEKVISPAEIFNSKNLVVIAQQ